MEFWDVIDEKGNKTGKMIERGKFPKELIHLGADVWIINSKNEILIQKRSANKKHSPNLWAMTGGSAIAGENSKDTILREVKEELGIDITKEKLILIKQYKVKHQTTSPVIIDTYLIKQDINISDITMQEEELSEVKWATWEKCEEIFDNGQFLEFRWEAVKYLLNCIRYIGKNIDVVIDRPIGSIHPEWKEHKYLTNYGYVPNTISGDGEEIDCYILGENKALKEYIGKCIALIHRLDDNDDKLVIVPKNTDYTNEQIKKLVEYQEQYFKSIIIR